MEARRCSFGCVYTDWQGNDISTWEVKPLCLLLLSLFWTQRKENYIAELVKSDKLLEGCTKKKKKHLY